MTKEYQLKRLTQAGYTVKPFGKNISVSKRNETHKGSISAVFKQVFGYR